MGDAFWPIGRRSNPLRSVLVCFGALALTCALTACSPTGDQSARGAPAASSDLNNLHPDVRAAVLRAREAAAAAEETAQRARDAEAQGLTAAERARRGEAGHVAGANDSGSSRYEGQVDASGVPAGFGVLHSFAAAFQGDLRAGEFGDETRARLGALRFGDNEASRAMVRYEGEFLNAEPAGSGVLLWRNGDRSAGLFRDGCMVSGQYTHRDGRRYEGDLENCAPGGHGVQWGPGGEVELQGLWQNDRLVTPLAP